MKNKKIKVCIVDDDILYIDSLKYILSKHENIWIHEVYNSGKTFIENIHHPFIPDICLIDLVLSDGSGIEYAKVIKEKFPEIKIIIMTSYPDLKTISEAKEIGADYIEKGSRTEAMIENFINTKFKDENKSGNYFSVKMDEDVKSFEFFGKLKKSKEIFDELTDLQKSILIMKQEGKSHKEIGKELGITENTVNTHIYRAMKKLNLPDILDFIVKPK